MTTWAEDFLIILGLSTYIASVAALIVYGAELQINRKPHWKWWIIFGLLYFAATMATFESFHNANPS